MAYNGVFIAIISVVILVVLVLWRNNKKNKDYLHGVWIADSSFLQSSELSDFQLFVSPEGTGYLIIVGIDGNFLFNGPITIHMYTTMSSIWSMIKDSTYSITINSSDGTNLPIPNELSMIISVDSGSLNIFDSDVVWAHLIKDHEASNAALTEWNTY